MRQTPAFEVIGVCEQPSLGEQDVDPRGHGLDVDGADAVLGDEEVRRGRD